ncbi:MAG: dockerin type I domain-containing protein [Myxococcota bacterium]|nr:dockerin type I domain-containing protein [Myxococcota bacterium]
MNGYANPCVEADAIQRYDYNRDGRLNLDDASMFRQELQRFIQRNTSPKNTALSEANTSPGEVMKQRLDMNRDQRVDALDSAHFFNMYRQCSGDGDINRDGTIDIVDLQFLMDKISSKEAQIQNHDLNADGLLNIKDVMYFRDMLCQMYEPQQWKSLQTTDGVGRWMVQRCIQMASR